MRQVLRLFVSVSFVWFVLVAMAQAQAVPAAGTEAKAVSDGTTTASRLVSISGVLKDKLGKPLTGVQGITFALYKDQEGGSPLWLETQNVTADAEGRFTALLGATKPEGLPLDLFSTDEARWLGVQAQVPGEVEQPRVLLVSVPYALKAADAETLGGKPASAFVLASEELTARVQKSGGLAGAALSDGTSPAAVNSAVDTPGGTVNFLSKFSGAATIVNSQIIDDGTNVGIGTGSPAVKFHLFTGTGNLDARMETQAVGSASFTYKNANREWQTGVASGGANLSSWNVFDATGGATRLVVDTTGNVGIGTANPAGKVHLFTATGNIESRMETQAVGSAGFTFQNANREWQIGVAVGGANLSSWNVFDTTGNATRLVDRKSTRLNSSHSRASRMPSSA